MKHLFLNKELSQLAKKKGFNEPCFAFYTNNKLVIHKFRGDEDCKNSEVEGITAPLYQQIVDWFREKYNLSIELTWDSSYEYEPGKWSDAIWSIAIMNLKDSMKNYSPDWQRRSGEQLEYYPALNKAIEEAFKLI